ncbi:MAG: hypothetical protein IPO92_05650 [Saprospiraceae bacterium]|nr:hypothetical protein [Saprospiraceae bacterium]
MSPSCPTIFNGRITLDSLNGTGPYHVILNNKDFGNRLEFNNLSSGTYDFVITDALGCVLEKSVILDDGPDLSISIDKELTILFGDSVLLIPQFVPDLSGRATLKWESRDSVLCLDCTSLLVRPFVNTLYTLTYSIDGQCGETTTVLVKVKMISKAPYQIFLHLVAEAIIHCFTFLR